MEKLQEQNKKSKQAAVKKAELDKVLKNLEKLTFEKTNLEISLESKSKEISDLQVDKEVINVRNCQTNSIIILFSW